MKRIFYFVAAVLLILPAIAYCQGTNIYTRPTSDWLTGNSQDPAWPWMKMIDAQVLGAFKGTGKNWYVDSNVTTAGNGSNWENAYATVDEAINASSADGGANRGDWIWIAPGHAESGSSANLWDADVAGITIWHCGNGADQGTYTSADTDTTIAIGASSVRVYGGRYLAGISEVVTGISVEAAADDCGLYGLMFPEPTSSAFEYDKAIVVAAGADRLTVADCIQFTADATGATNFLDLDTGVQNGTRIINNWLYGEYAEGAIHSDDIDLDVHVWGNTVYNLTTGQHGIEFTAAALGTYGNNYVYTDAEATSIDPGSLKAVAPNWITTAIDASPVMFPAQDDTAQNLIGYDDNNNAASTSNVAANADGTILERLENLQYFQETTVSKVATGTDDDLWDVAGGDIEILSMYGVVTTAIGATVTTCELQIDADLGAAYDFDFSTAVAITGSAEGVCIVFDNTVGEAVMTTNTGYAGTMGRWYCPEGMVEQNMSTSDNDGAITWYMTYRPMEAGVTVTAQ